MKALLARWTIIPVATRLEKLVLSRYKVDFSILDNRLFLFSVIVLGNDLSDTKTPIKQVCFERLVSDVEYFQWFFRFITDGKLEFTDKMLASFRTHGIKNTSSGRQQSTSAETVRRWGEMEAVSPALHL